MQPEAQAKGCAAAAILRLGSGEHMIVLSWLSFHRGHSPEDIATGLRGGHDVDEIERLCADLVAAGFIEPVTWQ